MYYYWCCEYKTTEKTVKLSKEELATLIMEKVKKLNELCTSSQHIIKELEDLAVLTNRLELITSELYNMTDKEKEDE